MQFEDVTKISNAAIGKKELLNNHPGKYLIRAVMAGFFVSMAMILCNVSGNVFASDSPAWGKLIGATFFGIAVLLIVLVGGELFTGNNFVMAFGAYDKKVSWGQVCKIWLASYCGNLVGSIFFSLLFVWAGASGTADYFAGFIQGKLDVPFVQMFFRAVLCNFFVCLAVLCGMKLKNEVAKIIMIVICICGFVFSGFEHSIANMCIFTAAYSLVPGLSLGQMIIDLLVVTAGNMVGGAVLLALPLRKMSMDE